MKRPSYSSDEARVKKLKNMREKYTSLSQCEKKKIVQKICKNTTKRKSSVIVQHTAESIAYDTECESFYVPTCSELHVLKEMCICNHCGAKKFQHETPTFCCDNGKIRLASVEIPTKLLALFTDQSERAKEFRKNIRALNSLFSFTSFGVRLDKELASTRKGVYTFRVQGKVYHDLPGLIPSNKGPCFFQLYFHDTSNELQNRMMVLKDRNVTETMVKDIMKIMKINPYDKFFRRLENRPSIKDVHLHISANVKLDQRVYNAPTVDQVAAIWIEGNNPHIPIEREIIVHSLSGNRHRIRHYYGCYDSLQYPLLFPMGEVGWHPNIFKVRPSLDDFTTSRTPQMTRDLQIIEEELFEDPNIRISTTTSANIILNQETEELIEEDKRKVSCREYYCHKFQIRPHSQSTVLLAGRLFQQYSVDQYIKIETTRLDYYRRKQSDIRSEFYQGIVDSVKAGETRGSELGTPIILPSTFIGGRRDMRRRYLDSMTLVQRFGKPDLFITMTCNPDWIEIQKELFLGQQAQDRPDLIARVFRAKLQDLKDQLFKKEIFGKVAAHVHVIEFQKRGLPHAHLLLILKSEYKINSPDQFDKFVCAEIPNKRDYNELHKLVIKHMMHGPCGMKNKNNSCMIDGRCKSNYPRDFCNQTIQGKEGYPLYRRRQTGETVEVRNANLDNRWVVPYNPYLLTRYNCHINVEICSGIQAVKYLYKYIYKGHDRVAIHVDHDNPENTSPNNHIDEIKQFQDGRWVSAPEALWRIFEFNLNEIYPAVIKLQLHLPNKQNVTYWANQDLRNVLTWDHVSKTMLTEYFRTCRESEKARAYFYYEFPEHYVWDNKKKFWYERKKRNVIGRINGAHPAEGERYYLRLLLHHIRGPKSFEDLLTIDNTRCASFKEAAIRKGLLESDQSILECLIEAIAYQMPYALRRLFATILVWCEPTDVRSLWESYYDALSEDYRWDKQTRSRRKCIETVEINTLKSLKSLLESMGKDIVDYDLPKIPINDETELDTYFKEIQDEMSNQVLLDDSATNLKRNLNPDQLQAYTEIVERLDNNKPGVFFVDGPGGTGKTYLYRALIAYVRSNHEIAIATATSGVAAHILPGGRTAHSRFKIPIDANDETLCNIKKQSELGNLLRATKLIIWDEAPMANKWAIETLDRTMQDMVGIKEPFGKKVIVFGGDYRQLLPVVPKGTMHQTIDASLVKSNLWPIMEKFSLSKNMRAISDPEFSEYLLRVGNGKEVTNDEGNILIPEEMIVKYDNEEASEQRLINLIYPCLHEKGYSSEYMSSRAILAPKNEHVDKLNEKMIAQFPGEERIYTSYDEAIDDLYHYYTDEFLNSLTPNGLPAHRLVLKKNCPIMLLRNLDPSDGMCNGTQMICKNFEDNVIHAEITEGSFAGKEVFIPRIPLYPKESDGYPFKFKRKQFPIHLCFAMTINKAQGQTIPKVGIYLPQSVFSHGQLYVALSRGISRSSTKVLIKPGSSNTGGFVWTKNVVYQDVLRFVESETPPI